MKTINYQLIEKYIFECIDFSEYQKQPETKAEQIAYLLDVCKSEKRYNNYKTDKYMFIDWCYGLPSCFKMDYQQYKVIELMSAFGLKIPTNDYKLFDVWYSKLYESVIYLNNKLNKK